MIPSVRPMQNVNIAMIIVKTTQGMSLCKYGTKMSINDEAREDSINIKKSLNTALPS